MNLGRLTHSDEARGDGERGLPDRAGKLPACRPAPLSPWRAIFLSTPFLLSINCLSAVATPPPVYTVEIGGMAVFLPAPEGFYRYDGKSDEVDDFQAKFVPATNRLLAAFGSESDLNRTFQHDFPKLDRLCAAEANSALATTVVAPADFVTVKLGVHEQIETMKSRVGSPFEPIEKAAAGAFTSELSSDTDVRLDALTQPEVFAETDDSICFSAVVKCSLTNGLLAGPASTRSVIASCTLRLHERVIYLYTTAAYKDRKDVDWARSALTRWRDAVIAANNSEGFAQPSESGFGGNSQLYQSTAFKVFVAFVGCATLSGLVGVFVLAAKTR